MAPRKSPVPRDVETGMRVIATVPSKVGQIALTTGNEAAEYLQVHPNTLRRWADKGLIEVAILPSGVRRFPIAGIVKAKQAMTSHWEA